jgi:glycosyltransferase involved in cell wall biosynthesis
MLQGDLQSGTRDSAVVLCASSHARTGKSVAILLCTYDGERFLKEQLDSIAAQRHADWTVWVSDDGSTDRTHAILETYRTQWGEERLSVHTGPGSGFVSNFLSQVGNAAIEANFYAFADQDDIWETDKLSKAVEWLETLGTGVPGVYCGRTLLVDSNNREIGMSPLFSRPPSFSNALVQSLAGGNTMVFNKAARRLLQEAGVTSGVVSHDWWLYLLVTGCGGQIRYDAQPCVRYRQHEENLVGSNTKWRARLSRFEWLLRGRFRLWNEQHIDALERIRPRFTPENNKIFERFRVARDKDIFGRLIGFARCGLYRQSFVDNLGLVAAALLKKL